VRGREQKLRRIEKEIRKTKIKVYLPIKK